MQCHLRRQRRRFWASRLNVFVMDELILWSVVTIAHVTEVWCGLLWSFRCRVWSVSTCLMEHETEREIARERERELLRALVWYYVGKPLCVCVCVCVCCHLRDPFFSEDLLNSFALTGTLCFGQVLVTFVLWLDRKYEFITFMCHHHSYQTSLSPSYQHWKTMAFSDRSEGPFQD